VVWYSATKRVDSAARAFTAVLERHGLRRGEPSSGTEPGVVVLGPQDDLADSTPSSLGWHGRILVLLTDACEDPWSLLTTGASEVVALSDDLRPADVLARLERWAAVDELVDGILVRSTAVGRCATWTAVLRDIVEVARFTASPVLLTGETGTGKEVVAGLIHELDARPRRRELVLLDCGSVTASLAESEFFGHEKGAFTGASATRAGAFELANGGTLFLDEVGELPAELQTALLRVVQEGSFKRVGGNTWHRTGFRLVAATNRDLVAEQQAGRFRRDLYYRLAASVIRLPPLCDRRPDIIPLFCHFLESQLGTAPALTPPVERCLLERSYPGNVRDLRQLALRVAARHVGTGPVTPGDIPPEDRPAPPAFVAAQQSESDWRTLLRSGVRGALADGVGLIGIKDQAAQLATEIAVAQAGGPTAAAKLLGVSRRTIGNRNSANRG